MKTGIVFSIDNKMAVILKNNGEFINVKANKSWKKGDIVHIKKEINRLKAYYSVAACFLVFMIGLSSFNFYYSEVALLSIDINPSIEIKINRFNRVISLKALNDEGSKIIETTDVSNKKYDEAIKQLIASKEFQKYTMDNLYIYFTVQSENSELENNILANLKIINSFELSYSDKITTEYFSVDKEFVNEAHSHGITAGKYKALLELKEVIPTIDIAQYSHHSIEDIKLDIMNHENSHSDLQENVPVNPTDGHHQSENMEHY